MKQWIIDRYNKGQDKYNYTFSIDMEPVLETKAEEFVCYISLYDFLFNPKWGFAKAFWGDGYMQGFVYSDHLEYEYHLQQMAISDDPLKYLEQFK